MTRRHVTYYCAKGAVCQTEQCTEAEGYKCLRARCYSPKPMVPGLQAYPCECLCSAPDMGVQDRSRDAPLPLPASKDVRSLDVSSSV